MPWTPESAMAAEKLPCPIIGEIFGVEVTIGTTTLKQNRFTVTWKEFGNPNITIDPIVELWRPLNEEQRKESDLHLSIFKHGEDQAHDGTVIRTYEISFGPLERSEIPLEQLVGEADKIAPVMLNDLISVCESWCTADNGLVVFLRERNKTSIDEYLIGIGRKTRKTVIREDHTTKADRRKAYLEKHPEHKRTARSRGERLADKKAMKAATQKP